MFCFCVQSPALFCVFHSLSVSCFTEPFLVSVSYFSFSLVFPCCLVVWFLTFCLLPGFLSTLPSGYCSPIVDYARLLESLPSIYLFAICLTLPVFLTMSINKSLHMDLHASRLVGRYKQIQFRTIFNQINWPLAYPLFLKKVREVILIINPHHHFYQNL